MAYRNVVKNPRLQARIFLTNWFVKIVRPNKELPEDTVQMHVAMDMNRIDVKNYLEKIYNIKVHRVNTSIQLGKRETVMGYDGTLKKKKYPDFKIAYVQLAEGTFRFPDLFDKEEVDEMKELEEETPLAMDIPEQPMPENIKKWFQV